MSLIDPMLTDYVLERILHERALQDSKWGKQQHDQGTWMLILQEELGEVAEAILNNRSNDEIVGELNQCAAVIVAWLECFQRGDYSNKK